jgi:hypothetical protein
MYSVVTFTRCNVQVRKSFISLCLASTFLSCCAVYAVNLDADWLVVYVFPCFRFVFWSLRVCFHTKCHVLVLLNASKGIYELIYDFVSVNYSPVLFWCWNLRWWNCLFVRIYKCEIFWEPFKICIINWIIIST